MEFCEFSLRQKLKEGNLNLEERKAIAIGVKNGEEYLSRIGISHYDPKPDNILLKKEANQEQAKWIDFGITYQRTERKSFREMGYARRGSKFRSPTSLCIFSH